MCDQFSTTNEQSLETSTNTHQLWIDEFAEPFEFVDFVEFDNSDWDLQPFIICPEPEAHKNWNVTPILVTDVTSMHVTYK
jgi:hypothetical protein